MEKAHSFKARENGEANLVLLKIISEFAVLALETQN